MDKPARITKPEREEIARLQRNYNAKIRRLQKEGVPSHQLPPKLRIEKGDTREVVNAIKRQMQEVSRRGNMQYQFVKAGEDYLTKAEVSNLKRTQAAVNRSEQRYHNENKGRQYRVISEEMQGLKTTRRTVGQDRHKEQPLKYTKKTFKSRADFEKYGEILEKRTKTLHEADSQLKKNIMSAINNQFGSRGKELAGLVEGLSSKTVKQLFDTTDIFNFDFFYLDSDGTDTDISEEDKLEALFYVVTGVSTPWG